MILSKILIETLRLLEEIWSIVLPLGSEKVIVKYFVVCLEKCLAHPWDEESKIFLQKLNMPLPFCEYLDLTVHPLKEENMTYHQENDLVPSCEYQETSSSDSFLF